VVDKILISRGSVIADLWWSGWIYAGFFDTSSLYENSQ